MSAQALKVLVVGATGSIGRLAVTEALRHGHSVKALVAGRPKRPSLPSRTAAACWLVPATC